VGKTIMKNLVERLHRFDEPQMNDHDKLDTIKREMFKEWQEHKRQRFFLHGEEITDDRLDMLLMYLIRKGLL